MHTYSIYGIHLAPSHRLQAPLPCSSSVPDLCVEFHECDTLEREESLPAPLWQSQTRTDDGTPQRIVFGLDHCLLVRYSGVGDFYIADGEINCRYGDSRQRDLLEIYLLGPVLSLWLELRGITCLHATGLEIDGVALALLGDSGTGKSTLAAHMVSRGVHLLTDDILPVEAQSDGFRARPGYPQMRMWPELAQRILGRIANLPRVLPDSDKRRVSIGPGGFGSFCAHARPLRRLYVLRRGMDGAEPSASIAVEPLRGQSALIEAIRHSFSAITMDAPGLQAARLARLGALVAAVPMREVVYPTGYERLDALRCAILRDARE